MKNLISPPHEDDRKRLAALHKYDLIQSISLSIDMLWAEIDGLNKEPDAIDAFCPEAFEGAAHSLIAQLWEINRRFCTQTEKEDTTMNHQKHTVEVLVKCHDYALQIKGLEAEIERLRVQHDRFLKDAYDASEDELITDNWVVFQDGKAGLLPTWYRDEIMPDIEFMDIIGSPSQKTVVKRNPYSTEIYRGVEN